VIKFAVPAAVLAGVLALGIWIDLASNLEGERVDARTSPDAVFAAGRVEGATREIEMRPRISGQLVRIAVRPGDEVQSGQVLLELDDEAQRHEIALAEADLELAQAQYERLLNGPRPQERAEAAATHRAQAAAAKGAKQRLGRVRSLRETKAASAAEADDVTEQFETALAQAEATEARLRLVEAPPRDDDLRIAKARIAAAQARLELARHTWDQTFLRAPEAGQVLDVRVEPGELVGPQSKEPAVVLADARMLQVRAFVEEIDAPRIALGMRAQVTADGLPGRIFAGQVTRVSPRMTSKRLTSDRANERLDTEVREIWIALEQHDGLVVGLRVDVSIEGGR
jgi:multidrug resistance efflux pump